MDDKEDKKNAQKPDEVLVSLTEPAVEDSEAKVETTEEGGGEHKEFPTDLPILPLEAGVVFPGMVAPAHVKSEERLKLVEKIVMGDRLFLALAFKGENKEDIHPENLYRVGTTSGVLQMLRMPDGSVRFLAQGLQRSRVEEFHEVEGHLYGRVVHLAEEEVNDLEAAALARNLRSQFSKLVDMLPNVGEEMKLVVNNIESLSRLADLVCSNLGISVQEKQDVLECLDVKERMKRVTRLLAREMEYLEVAQRIQREAKSEIDKGQREYYLRQQLKAIQQELGETDAQTAEVNELRERLRAKNLPDEARQEAERELDRMSRMNPASPEYSVCRTYLDWILDLPWLDSTPDNLDLKVAQKVLDEDHYGLETVKERVLECLAVRKLREDMRGSILCFAGPPGTGKTSIGKSIARAMGRKYVRISLGGVRDEAEIRGHRRTYIGALPGRIILGLKKAGSNNPVFMLDEIDKLGADFRGDPASALLEVLDPEQNFSYTDHYLDLPFDLSKVMFICTANFLDPVPPALKDRMEVLEFPGYTEEEKLQIARRYLVPHQREAHGLKDQHVSIGEAALRVIIREYTREAGVRNLERHIASICRKVAKSVATGEAASRSIGARDVPDLLGPPQFLPELAERTSEPGVACGLAWTPAGGNIIFVETTRTPGDGKLTLTGQLGDVMKESAQAALTYTRAHAEQLGIEPELFRKSDFHIHVPAGAIPKDGPSAGVTMAVALISLCTGRPVKHDVAMTGEITLQGKVLPVGGIKEKVLAATRAGISTVIMPRRNEKDMVDVPDYAKQKLQFIFAETVDDIVGAALEKKAKKQR
jgi:ATP-dependent Lon protease